MRIMIIIDEIIRKIIIEVIMKKITKEIVKKKMRILKRMKIIKK
jgi:hypothetical protein